ncbi:MAG: hypothetical protein ACNYZH_03675 [Acidimicrobiia bacterium]
MDGPKMIAGAIAGIVIAALGLVLLLPDQSPANGSGADPAAHVPESTTTTAVPWFAAGEVQFESTVLIPTEVIADDGTAVLAFDLETIAPSAGISEPFADGPVIDALPERWALSTVSGGGTIETTDPGASLVRFNVRTGLLTEHIASIRLIGWRVAVPNHERITLDIVAGASGSFAGGTDVTVSTILEQSNPTIVLLEIDQPHNPWDRIEIDAADPGWRKAGRLDGGLQFIWDGSDVPPILVLEQSSPTWVPVEGELVVFQGGVE